MMTLSQILVLMILLNGPRALAANGAHQASEQPVRSLSPKEAGAICDSGDFFKMAQDIRARRLRTYAQQKPREAAEAQKLPSPLAPIAGLQLSHSVFYSGPTTSDRQILQIRGSDPARDAKVEVEFIGHDENYIVVRDAATQKQICGLGYYQKKPDGIETRPMPTGAGFYVSSALANADVSGLPPSRPCTCKLVGVGDPNGKVPERTVTCSAGDPPPACEAIVVERKASIPGGTFQVKCGTALSDVVDFSGVSNWNGDGRGICTP